MAQPILLFALFANSIIFLLIDFPTVSADSMDPPKNLTIIFVAFRHGFRNPAQFLKNDTTRQRYGWGWEGESQLTQIGKQQAYGLGKFLRDRYRDQLPDEFQPSDLKAQSSSAERCQMTLATVLAGLYKPATDRSRFLPNLDWQPIPYQINDPLLRTYNLKCPTFTKAYQPISDDVIPASQEWLKSKADIVNYVAKHTGFNKSLSDLADVADNIQSMRKNNVPLPDWLQNPSLASYDSKSLLKEVLKFGEAHQIQCAEKPDCAQAMAGLWLDEIADQIHKGIGPKLTLRLYASHTEAVLSLLRLLNATVEETPPSAGFIIEYKKSPKSLVRLMRHTPDDADPLKRNIDGLKLPLKEVYEFWYDADDVVKLAKVKSFGDWMEFCTRPQSCWKGSCSP